MTEPFEIKVENSGLIQPIAAMSTATISQDGELVIPDHFRKALHLGPGDRVSFALEGERLVLQRDVSTHATLMETHGRKVLVASPNAPPMTTDTVKLLLAEFP